MPNEHLTVNERVSGSNTHCDRLFLILYSITVRGKNEYSGKGSDMERSQVYPLINYLVILRETTLTGRKTMLCNITRRQLRAISVVATSLLSGRINPLKRDSTFLKRSKGILETLSSRRISFERKKRLLNRHHSLIPVMLKTIYLIKTIVGDMVRMKGDVAN